ncbi:PadR family transcriptional regulator [Kitasatospora misakiensis]|uniref:PadR family transcriptional regulator n=1 Tax=Kitasatospora misakiensis TaxID=67330 RepID=A0ABW0X273_9ACTN
MKVTPQLLRVLRAFVDDPAGRRYGYELMTAAKLSSGTLYPLLARLEGEGMVESAWETPGDEAQRPRKYYRLTGEGVRFARLELAAAFEQGRPAPGARTRPALGDAL